MRIHCGGGRNSEWVSGGSGAIPALQKFSVSIELGFGSKKENPRLYKRIVMNPSETLLLRGGFLWEPQVYILEYDFNNNNFNI